MSSTSADVIIIGAGAAGLAAAVEVARAGRSVLVLEARDRVGGRIWSRRESGLAIPVEVGAEFIHGRSAAVFSLLHAAGMAAIDVGGSHWTVADGRLKRSDDFFAEVQQVLSTKGVRGTKDLSFEALLDRTLRRKLSESARAFARMLVEGFDAAEPARASARAIVDEWTGSGAADAATFRPLGGFGPLMSWLADQLVRHDARMESDTVVHAVRWTGGHVDVEATRAGKPFQARARCAVVTLPLAILQLAAQDPHAVRFTPAIAAKQRALKYLAMGPALKVVLRFRGAFWEEIDKGRYRNAAFLHAPQAAFPTFWTSLPVRAPVLVAWAGGPQTRRVPAREERDVVECALASLQSLFGRRVDVASELESACFHDWDADPYARGAYSYVTVGGRNARKTLAAPLNDTLFFAGEAADVDGESGTVAGALQSGVRAAHAVLGR